ncbi:MAG: transposase, partial [candidate division NC10 bacterium]|nr:transposase [candidate division NC10 bacterium]
MTTITHQEFEVKEVVYDPEEQPCPDCGGPGRRRMRVTGGRQLQELHLDHPLFLVVTLGVYACPNLACPRKAFRARVPFASKGAHYTDRAKAKSVAAVIRDQMPLTKVPERMEDDFHFRPGKTTIRGWVQQAGEALDWAHAYEPWVKRTFSGVLCLDEGSDAEFVVLVATDPLNGTTVGVAVEERPPEQTKTTATGEQMDRFLAYLKHLGIDVRVTIRDGSPLYPERVAQAFPATEQELCTFHLKQDVVKELLAAVRAYRKSLPDPPKRPKGRPRAEAPPPPPDPQKEIWKARGLFVMNPQTLKEREEQAQAAGRPSPTALLARLEQEHPPLQTIHSFADEVYALFTQPTPEDAVERAAALRANPAFQGNPHLHKALGHLSEEAVRHATLFLRDENLPATNNDAERAGRRFRKRQKAHYRLRAKELLRAVLQQELLAQKIRWERSGRPVQRLQPKEGRQPAQSKA